MSSIQLPEELAKYINKEFREQSLHQINTLRPTDIIPFKDDLIKENYTVVLRLHGSISQQVNELQNRLRQLEPDHYYYPTSQLHITLLGDIDIKTPESHIEEAVKLIKIPQAEFVLYGLGSNGYCSSISAYPMFDIVQVRSELRSLIAAKTDDYSIHLPAYEQMGWINFLRYQHVPSTNFLDTIRSQRNLYFGTLRSPVIQVYKNKSKVLSPGKSELVCERLLS